eukprot:Amastigsp_a178328_10.p3 type:complete len:104 gc:universal Amastigsp_a178328_10:1538-1227(-)
MTEPVIEITTCTLRVSEAMTTAAMKTPVPSARWYASESGLCGESSLASMRLAGKTLSGAAHMITTASSSRATRISSSFLGYELRTLPLTSEPKVRNPATQTVP